MRRILAAGIGLALVALTAAFVYQHYLRPPPPPPPEPGELESLRVERDALRRRLRALYDADESLVRVPRGSVVIGMPQALVRGLLERAASGSLAATRLTLRDASVRKSDVLKARTALGTQALGGYKLDLRVHALQGAFEPGAPRVRGAGLTPKLVLPLTLAGRGGTATLRLRWDGSDAAGSACAGFDSKRELRLGLLPLLTSLRGEFQITAQADAPVAMPRFPDTALKLRVEPSPAAWKAVDELVEAQTAECRAMLKRADVAARVRELLARGFALTLPGSLLRPVRLPAALRPGAVMAGGGRAALVVKPIALVSRTDRLWYGGDFSLTR